MQGVLSLSPPNLRSNSFCIRWTAKATDLVELLYALDTCDCINDGEIGVEELAYAFCNLWSGDKELLQCLYEHETPQG